MSRMIHIEFTRQNSNHLDRRKRHPSRASREVADRRYETTGPAPVYKLSTLLWLHGHGRAEFEVWDDVSPFGMPGGLAMRGKVRNWARLVNGKPRFDKDAPPETDFSPHERDLIARAAGRISDAAEIDSPRPENGRTARSHPSDSPDYPQERDGPSARVIGPQAPEAARVGLSETV